jgi:DNA-binding response OmpR family regulator
MEVSTLDGPSKPCSVLVIDDDDGVRRMLRNTLARAGYAVEDAANGKAGVECYRRRPSDIVIVDIIMPEREGLETIRELRRMNPRVLIIAISGGGHGRAQDYLQLAQNFGARRTLKKPFTGDEILNAIEDICRRGVD